MSQNAPPPAAGGTSTLTSCPDHSLHTRSRPPGPADQPGSGLSPELRTVGTRPRRTGRTKPRTNAKAPSATAVRSCARLRPRSLNLVAPLRRRRAAAVRGRSSPLAVFTGATPPSTGRPHDTFTTRTNTCGLGRRRRDMGSLPRPVMGPGRCSRGVAVRRGIMDLACRRRSHPRSRP